MNTNFSSSVNNFRSPYLLAAMVIFSKILETFSAVFKLSIRKFVPVLFLMLCSIGVWGQTYTQITTLPELTSGNYLLVGDGSTSDGIMLNTVTAATPYINYTTVTNPGANISTGYTANNVFQITVSGGIITIYNASLGYVSWGRTGNVGNTATFFNGTVANTEQWTPSVSGGIWSLTNVNTSTRYLQWNTSSPRFACYLNTQTNLKLYKLAGKTVTFDPNGGTGTMANQTSSVAANLNVNTFTRAGYTFAGWATTSGGAVAYADGASYPFAADATLYAKWTLNTTAPTVTTTTATSITNNAASSGGNVTSDGGASVTARGVYFGTSTAPTSGTSDGTGTGTYTSSLTGLAVNTQYFYRAYATNSVGTSYGTESSFYTLANIPSAPGVAAPTATSLNVNVTSGDGNPASTAYALHETTTNQFVQANGSLGASPVWQTAATWGTKTVTGLSPSTLYTFEVQARNGANTPTAYGLTASGTTLANETLDYWNLHYPATTSILEGQTSEDIFAQAYKNGLTEAAGQATGLVAWIGYSSSNTDPKGGGWTWVAATYSGQAGAGNNSDEFKANLGSGLIPGTYYYASRFQINSSAFSYGGLGGNWNNDSGVLTVNSNKVTWANIQSPVSGTIVVGDAYNVYSQVNKPGVTGDGNIHSGITAWIGYNSSNVAPTAGGWTWVPATRNAGFINTSNDEYTADIGTGRAAGTYYYASRYQMSGSTEYFYGGHAEGPNTGGEWGNPGANISGVLTVQTPPEINIKQTATILTGGTYAFGNQISGTNGGPVTFTIENLGQANLLLTGTPKIAISGTNSTEFSVNESATISPITGNSSTAFTVIFSPTTTGPKTAQLSIANNDTTGFEDPYVINLTGTATATAASDITIKSGYTYPQNIPYANYQAADITGGANDVEIAKFTIRDGGATADADNLATILTQLTLSTSNSANIRRIALYDGATEIAEQAGAASTIFAGLNLTAPDNGTKDFSVRVSFNTAVTDNQQIVLGVTATTTAAVAGSGFAATNAGGAFSSSTGDDNRIEVTADRLAFLQQPTDVGVGNNMTPAVTVSANDINANRDLDFVSNISITSTGTLTGSPVAVAATAGLSTFSTLVHTAAGGPFNLKANASTFAEVVSSAFNVQLVSRATDYFRSKVTGNWNAPGSWESSATNNGTDWITSTIVPSSSATAINIRTGHVITVTAAATSNKLTVDSGGTLSVGSGLSLAGSNTMNGTWTQTSTTATTNSGTLSFGATGIYNHNTNAGTIPTATWDVASTATINGMTLTTPLGLGQNFGKFTWNAISQSSNVTVNNNAFQVSGLFRLLATNGNTFTMGGTTTGTYTNTLNSVSIEGGIFAVAYTSGVTSSTTVSNDLSISGGEVRVNGSAGVGTLTVGRDLLMSGTGFLHLLFASTSPSTTLSIARDLIMSGSSGLDLEVTNTTSTSAVINVGRNFTSTSGGYTSNNVLIDFGGSTATGSVTGNAINIAGNFSCTGTGKIQTYSGNSPTGFVFNGTRVQTFTYTSGNPLDYTPITINSGSTLQLQNSFSIGSDTVSPATTINVNGTLDFQNYSITAATSSVPRFNALSGSTLISLNTNGLGGTSATGSLKSFATVDSTTPANGKALFANGVNYVFNASTITPFPTGIFGNPASLTFNSVNVTSNTVASIIVSGAVNVNGTSVVALNSAGTNSIALGGVMTIDPGAAFDNNGENQITNGGGSIVINGTFITQDAQGFTGSNTAIPSIIPTLGANSTVVYGKAGNQAVTDFAYRNITFAGSGIKTAGTTSSITGAVTINSGITLDADSKTFGGAGTNLTMQANSLFKTGGSGGKPDAAGTYTLDPNSTIEFQGIAATLIKVSNTYEKIVVSGTNVSPSGKNLLVNQTTTVTPTGIFTIPAVLDSVSSPYVITATKGITVQTGGTFNLENNAQLMQDAAAVNVGHITAKRNATVPVSAFNQYVYWSSPVNTQNFNNIFPGKPTSAIYYNEANDKFYTSSGVYIAGRGLAVRNPVTATGTATNLGAEFKGVPFVGDLNYPLAFTDASHGNNLVGNPYPSNIDIKQLYDDSPGITEKFQFWDNSANAISAQQGSNYKGAAYAIFNAATGTYGSGNPAPGNTVVDPNNPASAAGTKIPNHIVKVGQGFMVKATGAGTLNFKNIQRITDQTVSNFFGKNQTLQADDRYWLQLITPSNLSVSNAIVYFDGGNNGFAKDDSEEAGTSDALFTLAADKKVVINGRNVFHVDDVLDLGTRQFTQGTYKIQLGDKEGVFANGQSIYLKDKQTGIITNLSAGAYSFSAAAGESTGRFEIVYQPETVLATDGAVKEEVSVYRDGTDFVVKAQSKKITVVEVYDMAGRLIERMQPDRLKVTIHSEILSNGAYLLKINQGGATVVKKILK